MSQIIGSDKIESPVEDRPYKKIYPLGSYAPEVGINNRACLYIQFLRDLEYRPERAALARNSVIRGCIVILLSFSRGLSRVV